MSRGKKSKPSGEVPPPPEAKSDAALAVRRDTLAASSGRQLSYSEELELTRAELQEVRESRDFLASIVESSNDSIITVDFDLTITTWNGAAERVYGYPRAEAVGKPLTMLTLPKDAAAVLRRVESIAQSEKVETFDTVRLHKDQHEMWLSITLSPVKNRAGKVVGISTIARDVTARKVAERLQFIVENAREYAIFSMDLDRRITTWNAGAQAILGYEPEEILGQSADLIFTPEDRAAEVPEREALVALAQGRANDERWLRRKDGSRFWGDGVMMSMLDGRGTAVGLVKIFRDHTQVREAHATLEKHVKERTAALRQANAELSAEIAERNRLEQEILKISEREQRRIGQDLHDGLCQELAANAFMAQALATRLASRQPMESAELAKIAGQINEAVGHARDVARGLHPVELEAHGLMNALAELAKRNTDGVRCVFTCETEVLLHESVVALNLYRIAQEAVANAFKHAQPRNIAVQLSSRAGQLTLTITDDGAWKRPTKAGMGVHIMQYRARTIGASLSISQGKEGGTRVTCVFPSKKDAAPNPPPSLRLP